MIFLDISFPIWSIEMDFGVAWHVIMLIYIQQIDHLAGARAVMDVVRDNLLDLMIQVDIGSQCHRLVLVIPISEYAV